MTRRNIPIPADFAEHAMATKLALAERYGVCPKTISRWRRRCGIVHNYGTPKSCPERFDEIAPGRSLAELMKRYQVCADTIIKWRRAHGIPTHFRQKIVRPDDFAVLAAGMTNAALCRHYGRALKTIMRWREESGIPLPKAPAIEPSRRGQLRLVPGVVVLPAFMTLRAAPKTGRDEEAAQFMRRDCAVYRCTQRGGADQKGSHWRCGNAVLTAAELIERAERKGWDEHAWRRVA